MAVIEQPEAVPASAVKVRVVDVDAHPMELDEVLTDFVEEPYRSRYYDHHRSDTNDVYDCIYPPSGTIGLRLDALPGPGERADQMLERKLLAEAGVDYAILAPLNPQRVYDPEYDSALCTAQNRLNDATWLSKYNRYDRLWGSIKVSQADPVGAAREIERWAGHPRMVQVYMHPDSLMPLGRSLFDPIYEAATRHGLPVALHPKKAIGMGMLTPVGIGSYRAENFSQWSLQYMGHLASLVFSGVFERFPTLRIVCLESGFTWLPPFLWRLDRRWEALRPEVPHVTRRPSEYIAEHVFFSTQPIEGIDTRRELHPILEWLGADRRLMFSSDYPHYDYDAPEWVEPRLPEAVRERVLSATALELYGLPAARPRDELDATRRS